MKVKNIKTFCIEAEKSSELEINIHQKLQEYGEYTLVNIKYSCSVARVSNATMSRFLNHPITTLFSALIILEKPETEN